MNGLSLIKILAMKKYISTILFLSILSTIYGQQLDSIKYELGYLYYHSYGKGETIVMLSGGPGNNALQLESVALKLSENYSIILLEQRGTGISIPTQFDSTTITLKTSISDINLLLAHLKIPKTILLGHSWGGSLAMIYASQFPKKVKSLVLIAPGYFSLGWQCARLSTDNMLSKLGKQEEEQFLDLTNKSRLNTIAETERKELAKLRRLPYIFNKSKIDSLMPLFNVQRNDRMFNIMVTDAMKYNFDMQKDLQKIESPIHLICGRQDFLAYITYELKMARPNIYLYWVDKSGHFPMHEQSEKFYSLLDKILKM